MRAAIYLRQSEDRDDTRLAVDRQREDCQALAAARGWTTAEYLDNACSATSSKPRPAYQRMLADIRAGQLDAIISWDLDRLYRRPRELEDLIDLAEQRGLALATVGGEADLATDSGRLFARIKGAVARSEMERKSSRQKRANLQRAQAGSMSTRSTVPFGFRADHGRLVLELDEALAIREAYSSIVTGGTLHVIAKHWNAQGIPTRRGNPWTGATIRQLLLAHRNAGVVVYRGEPIGPGDWPPIVDAEIYEGARAILESDGRRPGGTSTARVHLLSGIALCGRCNRTIGSSKSAGVLVLACKREGCYGVSRAMAGVDDLVVGVVVGRLGLPDARDLLVAEKRVDQSDLRTRAAACRARQDEAAALFAQGEISASQLRTISADLGKQLAGIESKMLDGTKTRVLDGVIGQPREVFDRLSLDRKRAVISLLMTITILPVERHGSGFDPDSIRIDWKAEPR